MIFKVGGVYVTRSGRIAEITSCNNTEYPLTVILESTKEVFECTSKGRYTSSLDHELDLIKQIYEKDNPEYFL